MTLTSGQLLRLFQCGERYRLQDVEGVAAWPTTRQVVSRVVRDVIRDHLIPVIFGNALPEPQEARRRVEAACSTHLASPVYLSEQESAKGNRWVYENALQSALRMVSLWRAVVMPGISPVAVNQPYSVRIAGKVTVTGYREIVEANGKMRATRVRSRAPQDRETESSLDALLWGFSHFSETGKLPEEIEVDFLLDTAKVGIVRQKTIPTREQMIALEERVVTATQSIQAGVFVPADPADWRCQRCPHRPLCRFV